uniref:Uncharacterized protein n=1 Tax=Ciona intestinalis TaxID=7719 RepID=F6QS94_CIOIN
MNKSALLMLLLVGLLVLTDTTHGGWGRRRRNWNTESQKQNLRDIKGDLELDRDSYYDGMPKDDTYYNAMPAKDDNQ